MDNKKNNKNQSIKITSTQDKINYDYDWNSEYGDGDIPDIDKPRNSSKDERSSDLDGK